MTITRRGVSESFAKSAPADGQPGSISWETALLRRARDGEAGAFGELLRFYEARVFSLVHRYVHRRDEAAEVAQEVFLQAFKSSHRFEEGKPFRPWLFKIAINVCRNHRRLGSRRELPSELEPHQDSMWHGDIAQPADGLHEQASREQLESLLAALSPEDRALVQLRFNEDMPYGELSRVFKRPEALLKMRVHRALKRMRGLVEGRYQ
jgi:RNA polymerase sigma-70 factor, ECF subfamily